MNKVLAGLSTVAIVWKGPLKRGSDDKSGMPGSEIMDGWSAGPDEI